MTLPKKPTQVDAKTRLRDDVKTDAILNKVLRTVHERAAIPMSTEQSIREGAAFMEQMRKREAVALLRSIERKELITTKSYRTTYCSPSPVD